MSNINCFTPSALTSFYGCELWSLTTSELQDFCTAWRKAVRSVWNLPQTTHCYLLPLICDCLPVFDEICRRSINFARDCILHESSLIRQIASYGIYHARRESPLGRNMLFCADRYSFPLNSLARSKALAHISIAPLSTLNCAHQIFYTN